MKLVTERLIFAVHRGAVAGEPACSHSSWARHSVPLAENGVYALWEATGDVEEFFGETGITHIESVERFK